MNKRTGLKLIDFYSMLSLKAAREERRYIAMMGPKDWCAGYERGEASAYSFAAGLLAQNLKIAESKWNRPAKQKEAA